MLAKEKWFITFICHAITFLIYFDIPFNFEIKKKKKKVYLLQEGKKVKRKKSSIRVHQESNSDQQIQSPTR